MPINQPRYTSDRWGQLRPVFIRCAILSGAAFGLLTLAVVLTQPGDWSAPKDRMLRSFLDFVWETAAMVFAGSGGTLLLVWLINRYGDRPGGNDR